MRDSNDFCLKDAREKLKKADWKESILPYSYRPFDNRYICYRPELIDRDRFDVMKHFPAENVGLVFPRLIKEIFNHGFVTQYISDVALGGAHTGSETTIAPLYIYQRIDKSKKLPISSIMMLFEPQAEYGVKKPNLSPALIEKLTKGYKKTTSPEQIFFYIYSILYSNIYRKKYAEFLKIDFPKIPFTKNYKLFKKMGEYGESLVDLHLLKSSDLESPIAKFLGKGDNRVVKLRYEHEKLYINNNQYFEPVVSKVWEYQIGGYQVCNKWLKDRKEKILSLDDIKIYCKIVTALQNTIEIQKAIDEIYPEVEKEIIEFATNKK